MKATKINNAEWMATAPVIAEHVERFCNKIKVKGLHGPNLFAYLSQIAQFGGDMQEFWIVFNDNNEPIAFSAWQVMGLPMVAKVYMPFLHSWERPGGNAAKMLLDEYIKFGIKHNAVWYSFDPISEKHYEVLERTLLKTYNQKLQRTGVINCISKRVK